MTTSNTFTTLAFDDLLVESLARIGIRSDQINNDHITEAARSVRLMLTAWAAEGFKQYQMQLYTPTLTAGQPQLSLANGFAFPTGTLQIFSSIIIVPGAGTQTYAVPMIRIARYDYEQIPDKTNPGRPDRFFWDGFGNDVTKRYMQLWPVPDQAYTLRIWCIVRSQDIGGLTNTADVGEEWQDAFAAGLTLRLAEKYAPDRFQEKQALFSSAYAVAKMGERERGPSRFRVDHRTRESSR